jgi:hypothetical protein
MRTQRVVDCSAGPKTGNISAFDEEIPDAVPDPALAANQAKADARHYAITQVKMMRYNYENPELQTLATHLCVILGLDD